MCGILFYSSQNKINKETFQKSLDSIIHRGPDDEGIEYINNVTMGARRLSIQDLSPKGHMPMSDISKRYWITLNGEIYNFNEVKKDLSEFNFRSNSDTEVVLYSYIKWGRNCLEKFNGMFAFVIYDSKENSIFFARDRFGKKPLLYFYNKKELIIASEAKQLLKIKPQLAEFDTSEISNLLSFRYIPNNKTGFKNIFMLPPASFVELKIGEEFKINKYWDFLDIKEVIRNENETLELVEKELIKSVQYRLISDVPVGVFLSGGLDSSLITAIASNLYKGDLQTFSVGYSNNDAESEFEYANIVAEKYETTHSEIIIDFEKINIQNEISDLFNILDRPIADPAIFPSLLMSKEVSKKLKVVLNGDGGDELFAGYGRQIDLLKIHNYFKIPKAVRQINYQVLKTFSKRYGFIFEGLLNSEEEAFLYKTGCFHPKISNGYYIDKLSILKEEFQSDSSKYLKNIFFDSKDLYKKAEIYDVKSYMPDCTLPKIDFATMGASLEARSPFLDKNLAEIAFSISYDLKTKNGIKKYVTKKIAEKYLPHDIIYRKKQGFSVPFAKWFREDLHNYTNDLLLNKNSFVSNYLNIPIIERLLEDNKRGVDYSNHIWILLTLENWGQRYIYGKN